MEHYKLEKDAQGNATVHTHLRGHELLDHAILNKGSGFSEEERKTFGLDGLLPWHVSTQEEQTQRIYENISRKTDPLEKYIGLAALMERNEHLFYHLLLEHVEEFAPIVYTPTIGAVCQQFSKIFRKPRGLWITPAHKGRIAEVLRNSHYSDIRLIVVTDNERILGLGDQGAGGMGIPVGKLTLYTLAAGIHPTQTLPISLDVGTDNKELLADSLYLGYRQPRLRGPLYDELVDEFVTAVKAVFPHVLLQWEDFKKQNAFDLLDRYHDKILSFNDDIQGTAAISMAGVIAAGRITGTPIQNQRIVMLGAGAAGIGISRLLKDAMIRGGSSDKKATESIAALDSKGLLIQGHEYKETSKRDFAWSQEAVKALGLDPTKNIGLLEIVKAFKPTVLIGTTGEQGAFTQEIIEAMAAGTPQPIIFPLSNPTSNCEALPTDVQKWTKGKAIVATGSPFAPVEYEGRSIPVSQANNIYIFPGVGLGAIAARATIVTDAMFTAAAQALAGAVSEKDLQTGRLFPQLREIRRSTAIVATAVARQARDEGSGPKMTDAEIDASIKATMWVPEYPKLVAEGK